MPRFLILRVNRNPNDTWAVRYSGSPGESIFDALDIAMPDPDARLEYAIVDAVDTRSAKLERHADWETVPARWVDGWRRDMPEVLQGTTQTRITDKTDIEELAKLFGLPSWKSVDELNSDYYFESAAGAENETEHDRAFEDAQNEVYAKWYDAVEHVANSLLEKHGLELQPIRHPRKRGDRRPFQMKIIPSRSWEDAADRIRETINGVGMFHFHNLREFLDSGPYTARQTVLTSIGQIRYYPEIYGTGSPMTMYQHYWS